MVSLKIALCQIVILDGDRAGNFIRIAHAAAEAKEKQAEIVCFPEMCLFGWVNPIAHEKAFPIPGEDSDRLCLIAKQYGIHLCIGLAEKEGKNLYDSVIFIDSSGTILLKHRKINLLTGLMTPPYTPGTDIKAVDTQFGRIGMLICADTFEKDLLLKMKAERPDLVLVPYGWAEEADMFPEHGEKMAVVISNAAKLIGAPVVGTDVVGMIHNGPWKGRVYGGQSAVSDASGSIVLRMKDRDRDMQVISLSL